VPQLTRITYDAIVIQRRIFMIHYLIPGSSSSQPRRYLSSYSFNIARKNRRPLFTAFSHKRENLRVLRFNLGR